MNYLLEDKRFYIYVYLNPLKWGGFVYCKNNEKIIFDYQPFYIGKGLNDRCYEHINEANKIRNKIENESINFEKEKYNKHKIRTINKILKNNKEPIIFKLHENLNEKDSFILEKFYINLIGRYDKNLGPLTNHTEGGVGGNTIAYLSFLEKEKRNTKISLGMKKFYENNPEALIAWSIFNTEKWKNKSEIEKQKWKNNISLGLQNHIVTEETKEKMSISGKNKIVTEQHCENISKGVKKLWEQEKNNPDSNYGMKNKESSKKDKTYEEQYGEEKAEKIKENLSKAQLNRFKHSSVWNKGIKTGKQSEETCKKKSMRLKGRISPMKGRKASDSTREKQSKSHKGLNTWSKGCIGSNKDRKYMYNIEGERKLIKKDEIIVYLEKGWILGYVK